MNRRTPRPEVRDPWYRAVISHPTLTNGTKLLLVVLVDDMGVYGHVSVPRTVLAKKLGLHPARITERIKEAVDARVLDVVVKGRPGVTSEYQALIPVGTPVRTKRARRRINADGAPVRTSRMVRPLYQVEVHPSAPSAERELGTPVRSASTTHPTCTDERSAVGEEQPVFAAATQSTPPPEALQKATALKREEQHQDQDQPGACAACEALADLDALGTCSIECAAEVAATARSAS